ncbi:MAG: M67 family metallopeptidase [Deltaproteobacteria bacterium]|nr:M67 family metallopeptidase [Deltaproteobacteria bacterium]
MQQLPGQIEILSEFRQEMIAHARRDLPNECCGLLIGTAGRIGRVVPMRSTEPASDAYFMDPIQQVEVLTGMERQGEELIGIYHSHPRGPLEPSGMDLQLAFHPEAVYVIVSLGDPQHPDIGAFVLNDGRFRRIEIR